MSFLPHEVIRPQRQANYQTVIFGLGHSGILPTGVRAEMNTPTQEPTVPTSAEIIRLHAAKNMILAEVDRIQKRIEIRKSGISEEDSEVLYSLRKVLKALDPDDLELLTRINALLKS